MRAAATDPNNPDVINGTLAADNYVATCVGSNPLPLPPMTQITVDMTRSQHDSANNNVRAIPALNQKDYDNLSSGVTCDPAYYIEFYANAQQSAFCGARWIGVSNQNQDSSFQNNTGVQRFWYGSCVNSSSWMRYKYQSDASVLGYSDARDVPGTTGVNPAGYKLWDECGMGDDNYGAVAGTNSDCGCKIS
jgi:hypothetical protein